MNSSCGPATGGTPISGWDRDFQSGSGALPFIVVLLYTVLIYFEGLPGLRWIVWTARLGLLAGVSLWFFRRWRGDSGKIQIPLCFWAFFGYSFSSVFWSASVKPFLAVGTDLAGLCLFFFLVVNLIDSKSRLEQIMTLISGITAVFAVVTLVKALFGLERPGVFPGQDPNILGFYLLLGIGIQLALVFAGADKRLYWMHGALLGLSVLALICTESRGDFLALLAMFGAFCLLSPIRKRWIFFAGMILASFLFFPPGSILWERFISLASDRGNKRLDIWLVGWEMIKHHFWLGVGMSNFPVKFGTYIHAAHTSAPVYPETGVHNSIIGIWSELGLAGLTLFGWVLFNTFNHSRRLLKRLPAKSFEAAAVKGLVISGTGLFVASLCLGAYFRKYFWLPSILLEALYCQLPGKARISPEWGVKP